MKEELDWVILLLRDMLANLTVHLETQNTEF